MPTAPPDAPAAPSSPGPSPGPPPALSVVIPAWNEAERIGPTLDATLAWLDRAGLDGEVIVVDDGSTDGTARAVTARASLRPSRVRLLGLGRNRGKGFAVRVGVLASRGARVLFMDADLATPIEEYGRLARRLDEGADVAIGSRAVAGAEILTRQHPLRESMGKGFNLLVRALLLGAYRDTQCGFKLFSREAALALFAAATVDRFAFDVELLLLARGRFRVVEEPVVWRHVEQSKVSPVKDAARMALDVLRIRTRLAVAGALGRDPLGARPDPDRAAR